MSDPVEKLLFDAAWGGSVDGVSSLLKDHPEINVNWTNDHQLTPLHAACWKDRVAVVKLLLTLPNINVNVKDMSGRTPFSLSCFMGSVSAVLVLLKDSRVNVALENHNGCTPLWFASYYGQHEIVEWLIASGRDLGDIRSKKQAFFSSDGCTALEIARQMNAMEIVSLLERFMANPTLTRHELRVRLGVLKELAAELFAAVVFLCDGLLQRKPASHPAATPKPATDAAIAATRFFAIAEKLPIELQMILCQRVVGSVKDSVLSKDSEAAFKFLARVLLLLDSQSALRSISRWRKQGTVGFLSTFLSFFHSFLFFSLLLSFFGTVSFWI